MKISNQLSERVARAIKELNKIKRTSYADVVRLDGKIEGLNLALSYLRDIERINFMDEVQWVPIEDSGTIEP